MKKILFISILCATLGFLTSCTADDYLDQATSARTVDTGGQHGIPPPPPPPIIP